MSSLQRLQTIGLTDVQARLLWLLRDGRERTTTELRERLPPELGVTQREAATILSGLRYYGAVTSAPMPGFEPLVGWRLAPAVVTTKLLTSAERRARKKVQ